MKLVYVGTDRQLHLVRGLPESAHSFALTAPPAFTMVPAPQDVWSWPTWSPDGAWIAAFAVTTRDDESGPARVVTTSEDGVRQTEWAEIADAAPLYLQWHPSGEALCVLTQVEDDLQLGLIHADRLGVVKEVASGVPLFFNWTPDGARVWVHHGDSAASSRDGLVVVRDPLGDDEDRVYPRAPGSFCAPMFSGESTVIAIRAGDGLSTVVRCNAEGAELEIAHHPGLIAMAPGPGSLVAITSASGGEGSPYRGIELVDLRNNNGAEPERINSGPLLAFTWVPDGSAMVVFRVDAPGNCMSVLRVDRTTGAEVVLGTFWPTRDLFFWLHFFDQFVQSHPLVSPDSRWVTWAGYPAGDGQADLSEPPRIWVRSLVDLEAAPIVVGRGLFATFPSA